MKLSKSILAAVLLLATNSFATAQEHHHGQGAGEQQRNHGRGGMAMDDDHRNDMEMFHYLLDHKEAIERTVIELSNGVETVTESSDPQIADAIREHVRAMYSRLKEQRPIHRRDPLFAEIFRYAAQIEMTIEDTERGVRVRETSSDAYVAKLIQSHAKVVTAFVENGRLEMRENHAVPERD